MEMTPASNGWASFRETWYGEGEPYRGGVRLIVKIGPTFPKAALA